MEITTMFKFTFESEYFPLTINASDAAIERLADEMAIHPKGLAYLLQYGIDQALGDKTAGVYASIVGVRDNGLPVKVPMKADRKDELRKQLGLSASASDERLARAYCQHLEETKWNAILNGTIKDATSRDRLTPIEKMRREVVAEWYKKLCTKMKMVHPSDADELKIAHENYYAVKKNLVDDEAEARLAAKQDAPDMSDEELAMLLGKKA
jgi:hypothetical protein